MFEKFLLLIASLVLTLSSALANGETPSEKKAPKPAEVVPPAASAPNAPTPPSAPEAAKTEPTPAPEPAIPSVTNSTSTPPAPTPPAPDKPATAESNSSDKKEPKKAQSQADNKDSLARSIVTSSIDQREPVDDLNEVPNSIKKVYYFSELVDLKGEEVTHRWLYKDKVQAEVKFKVGGKRWRVYSSKNLLASWTGTWTVEVALSDGTVIGSKKFDLIEASADSEAEAVGQL